MTLHTRITQRMRNSIDEPTWDKAVPDESWMNKPSTYTPNPWC